MPVRVQGAAAHVCLHRLWRHATRRPGSGRIHQPMQPVRLNKLSRPVFKNRPRGPNLLRQRELGPLKARIPVFRLSDWRDCRDAT